MDADWGPISEAVRVLCMAPDAEGNLALLPELAGEPVFCEYLRLLEAAAEPPGPGRADLIDYLNHLVGACGELDLAARLERGLFIALNAFGARPGAGGGQNASELEFRLRFAEILLDSPRAVLAATSPSPRWTPAARAGLEAAIPAPGARSAIERIGARDPFGGGRVYRYSRRTFTPTQLLDVRPPEKFFGFAGVRQRFQEHFADFAAGRGNVPLLISSLPGHGKTQLTIANALAQPELTLILPPPEVLEHELAELFEELRRRPDRRFVVFFDDIEPDGLDWYEFRTRVGGAFSPPGHVLVAAASNYFFPPSILSRGRSLVFPIFDEIRCLEMIEDFLAACGMRHPNRNLISMIGADYCEAFGQKQFSELSPRTLIRHLALYEQNREKRRMMLELSRGQLITRPDAQLFYDFNLKQMRSLYGKEYLDELLQEKLRALENGV